MKDDSLVFGESRWMSNEVIYRGKTVEKEHTLGEKHF